MPVGDKVANFQGGMLSRRLLLLARSCCTDIAMTKIDLEAGYSDSNRLVYAATTSCTRNRSSGVDV
jgi:hypothetical protein